MVQEVLASLSVPRPKACTPSTRGKCPNARWSSKLLFKKGFSYCADLGTCGRQRLPLSEG
jgi:hypothetical protein